MGIIDKAKTTAIAAGMMLLEACGVHTAQDTKTAQDATAEEAGKPDRNYYVSTPSENKDTKENSDLHLQGIGTNSAVNAVPDNALKIDGPIENYAIVKLGAGDNNELKSVLIEGDVTVSVTGAPGSTFVYDKAAHKLIPVEEGQAVAFSDALLSAKEIKEFPVEELIGKFGSKGEGTANGLGESVISPLNPVERLTFDEDGKLSGDVLNRKGDKVIRHDEALEGAELKKDEGGKYHVIGKDGEEIEPGTGKGQSR